MKKKIILAVTVIACMVCSIGATSCTYAEDTNLEYSYSIDNSKTISLKGSTAQSNSANVDVKNSTITIKSAGTYRITGTLNNGQIIVNAGKDDTVTLILDNANINCSTSAPIYSKQSGTTVVYLADKSTNTLTDTATNVEKENSAIYAQDNLVIAGTGSNCTETAIYLSQEAEKNGADGLLVVSPYYNKATQKGLIAHFSSVANSVKIPMLLYNITGRTGVTIQPATIAHLWKNVDNIVGVKEANGDFSATATLMNLTDGGIDLYSGNDDQIVPLLSLGGKGVISVLSNVAPAQAHEICAAYFAGDVKRSAKLQLDAIPLIHALFSEVNPIPVKAAMNLLGKETGPLRMPLTEMEPEHQEVLKKELQAYGLL